MHITLAPIVPCAFQLFCLSSQDLNSEGDGSRTRERRQPRSSSAAELRETVSDRDNTTTPPQSLRKRSVLRAPLDTSRTGSRLKTPNAWSTNGGGAGAAEPPQPPSKQYTSHPSASSVGDEGKGGRRVRKRGKEGHTWTGEGTQERVDERTRTPSEESQSSNPESEGEGSPGSHTESPTPPQHVSIGQVYTTLYVL